MRSAARSVSEPSLGGSPANRLTLRIMLATCAVALVFPACGASDRAGSRSAYAGGSKPGSTTADGVDAGVPAEPFPVIEVARPWSEPARSADELPESMRGFFEPGKSFKRMRKPKPGEWLAEHAEDGQTVEEFIGSFPNLPSVERHILYIVPVGAWGTAASEGPPLREVAECASEFFGLPVRVSALEGLDFYSVTKRRNEHTGKLQLLTRDILDLLIRQVPEDAYAVIALTKTDLYPHPSWNFVFGEAMLRNRVAVHSLARYEPGFYGPLSDEAVGDDRLRRRILGVTVHEVGHMFGLEHCTAYRCVFNGSNSLEETDRSPMQVCPVCLHKLHYSIGFDPRARYEALRRYYASAGLDGEARWIDRRLAEVGPAR